MPAIELTQTRPSVQMVTCPSCGGAIALRAAGYSVTLVCQFCSSMLDLATPETRIINAANHAATIPAIALGRRGRLNDIDWEVIGYLERSDYDSQWQEYLLFNPYHGYRWLIDQPSGWSLGTMITQAPSVHDLAAPEDQILRRYRHEVTTKVDYVLGEFYWRVAVGDSVLTTEYLTQRFMFVREDNASETSWTRIEWLPDDVMVSAFGVDRKPSWFVGGPPPLPYQPSPIAPLLKPMAAVYGALILAMLLANLFFGAVGGDTISRSLSVPYDRSSQSVLIGQVTLDRPYQAVALAARANALDNSWIDIDYSLINQKTQESFDSYGTVERYSGYDSDGYWTEGDRSHVLKIASVPKGTYDVIVDATAHHWGVASATDPDSLMLSVSVKSRALFWSMFWIFAILGAIPLALAYWFDHLFEQAK